MSTAVLPSPPEPDPDGAPRALSPEEWDEVQDVADVLHLAHRMSPSDSWRLALDVIAGHRPGVTGGRWGEAD